jgi:hypothetical protein
MRTLRDETQGLLRDGLHARYWLHASQLQVEHSVISVYLKQMLSVCHVYIVNLC